MPHLDLLTVKVVTLLTMSMISCQILISLRTVRRVPGMRVFAAGLLALSMGAIVGITRVVVGGAWNPIACQALMIGGMIVIIQGLRAFRGVRPMNWAAIAGIIGLCCAPFLYWLFGQDDFAARVALISIVNALLCFDGMRTLCRPPEAKEGGIYRPGAAAFAIAAINYSARAGSALSGHYGRTMLTAGPMDVGFTICSCAAYISGTFGVLFAANARAKAESERMALFDPLTNLPNRRHLFERFASFDDRRGSVAENAGLIYLDLDGFKEVNDFLGHAAGDELLLKISRAMGSALRTEDCLARIGGDEFVALIEHPVTRAELDGVAGRLQAAVEDEPVCDGLPWRIRVSCGTALFPDDGHSMHEVMREADAAMYAVKRRRRVGAALAS